MWFKNRRAKYRKRVKSGKADAPETQPPESSDSSQSTNPTVPDEIIALEENNNSNERQTIVKTETEEPSDTVIDSGKSTAKGRNYIFISLL